MPAPIAPLLGLTLGALFAWALGEGSPGSKGTPELPRLALVCAFALLVFAPTAAYFIAFAPDWAYAYLIDGGRRLGPLDAALLLSAVASVPAGYLFARWRARGPGLPGIVQTAGLPLLVAGIFLILFFPRLGVHASYAQFHGDFGTRPVAGGPLGYALLWTTSVLAAAALWTAYALRRLH